MNKLLEINNISKSYGDINAIGDISLTLYEGEILGIVGTSGCGKSTLLNIISNLETKSGGTYKFFKKCNISYMFQTDALLSYKSILDNACLPLELSNKKTNKDIEYVKDMLINYGLKDFINKKPKALSGGMKQRVSLVRALSTKPSILLLDEPFSALDYYNRLSIAEDVLSIISKNKISAILVTHDIAEAISMCDRIIVLTSRPSKVKCIYPVNIDKTLSIIEKRQTKEFNILYEKIWRDLQDERKD